LGFAQPGPQVLGNEVWAIRDEIDSRVQQVLEELVGTRG
jgi:hypothetical protein